MKTIWIVLITLAASLLAVGLILFLSRPIHGKSVILLPPPTESPIMVHVTGAVNQPGVVSLPPNSRVQDAIQQAGGLQDQADTRSINLAGFLQDGQQIIIPSFAAEPTKPAIQQSDSSSRSNQIDLSSPTPTAQFPVNINTANQEELEALPEIGPVTAVKIIEYRELNGLFTTIEDIQKVNGIGPKTYEAIKDLIITGP
jgi:competence protein ComEA